MIKKLQRIFVTTSPTLIGSKTLEILLVFVWQLFVKIFIVVRMQMVIKNCLSNAIKHTPKNKHIYIVYNENIISIENEGEFISVDQMNRIWDTYVSSDREGTGLGLAICKTILDLHHYGYYVENTSRGVKFTITINKKSC